MRTHISTTLTFEPSDAPAVIPSPELQMVCLTAVASGYGIWFTVDQIPQVEQLLSLLWAMKDEQDQQGAVVELPQVAEKLAEVA